MIFLAKIKNLTVQTRGQLYIVLLAKGGVQ